MAEVHAVAEVDANMAVLLQGSKVASATHNIVAYRLFDADRRQAVQVRRALGGCQSVASIRIDFECRRIVQS